MALENGPINIAHSLLATSLKIWNEEREKEREKKIIKHVSASLFHVNQPHPFSLFMSPTFHNLHFFSFYFTYNHITTFIHATTFINISSSLTIINMDNDFGLNYHLDKANIIEDAFSRKSLHMATLMVRELDLIEQFRDLSLVCEVTADSVKLGMLKLTSGFLVWVMVYDSYLLVWGWR